MLELKQIKKDYQVGEYTINALRGIDLRFPERGLVAILGPSGCGKTTLLNIIGGLDTYTDGDLIINGRSTKSYKSADWDQYRNHAIGFVFQSYNLIPHQSVLSNVELALTIGGISRRERRKRAIEALENVGLGDELYKKPNQVSGGQSQRVAIARALVTDPDIILADEPTGALDSETSRVVMDILKQVSEEKLVIIVTHNRDLAEAYADRIIQMKDGLVKHDSRPYAPDTETEEKALTKNKAGMSLATAFRLSLYNLWSKKSRTFLTAFAGSIGIIGIALIFALSNGIQLYIDQVQEDTLTAYPIAIEREVVDTNTLLASLMAPRKTDLVEGEISSENLMFEFMQHMTNPRTMSNDLESFKTYVESDPELRQYVSTVHYSYQMDLPVFTRHANDEVYQVELLDVMEEALDSDAYQNNFLRQFTLFGNMQLFEELVAAEDGTSVSGMITSQYELIHGRWPLKPEEIVFVLPYSNRVADITLYSLGLKDKEDLNLMMDQLYRGEALTLEVDEPTFTYDDFMNLELKVIMPGERYRRSEGGTLWVDLTETPGGRSFLYDSKDVGLKLKVVGIIRAGEDASYRIQGSFAYLPSLTRDLIARNNTLPALKEQKEDETYDILQGKRFMTDEDRDLSDEDKLLRFKDFAEEQDAAARAEYFFWARSQMPEDELQSIIDKQMERLDRATIEENLIAEYAEQMGINLEDIRAYIETMSDEELFSAVETGMREQIQKDYAARVRAQLERMPKNPLASAFDSMDIDEELGSKLYDEFVATTFSDSSFEENLKILGEQDPDAPERILLYAKSFTDKDGIADCIAAYNDSQPEEKQIQYTDYIALLMSSITLIISGITYVLVAFVAISLVVSSIMIGIITYISVLERTKEIGILRALGASKRNVSQVFNAETIIEGLAAGALGVAIASLLIIPINSVIQSLTNIDELRAVLPWQVALALLVISFVLTLIAGLIPSRVASNMHPVDALRTE